MRRSLVIGGIATAAAAAYAWYARSSRVRDAISRTPPPEPAPTRLPRRPVAPTSASVAATPEVSPEPELAGEEPGEAELAEVDAEAAPAHRADAPPVSRHELRGPELAPVDSDETDETPAPVAATDARVAGERLEWLMTAPSPGNVRRRRQPLGGALARSLPLAALGGAILLLNLAVVAALASTKTFDAMGDWLSSWISLGF